MIKKNSSWKLKVILLGIIINIFLISYLYFYQNPQHNYYKIKIQEIEKQLLLAEISQESIQRYTNFFKDKKEQKKLGKEKLTNFNIKMKKKFQDLKLFFKKETLSNKSYYDFYFWQEKITFQSKYKTLLQILKFSANQEWKISNLTIDNKEPKKNDPLLQVTIIFVFIIEKL